MGFVGISRSSSFFFVLPLPFGVSPIGVYKSSSELSIAFIIVFGTMPCSLLYKTCFVRRRFVSSIAACIEFVILSAYIITCPSALRAARPKVCISEEVERKKPSLSASSMATKETSGISRPSLKRLMPISTSNSPSLKLFKIATRSRVSMSECRYFARTFICLK